MADPTPYPGTPRWVKVLGIVALVLSLLLVLVLFTGIGGEHGPRRHLSTAPQGSTPPIAYQGHRL